MPLVHVNATPTALKKMGDSIAIEILAFLFNKDPIFTQLVS